MKWETLIDSTPGITRYYPGHPHADDKGYFLMPNVSKEREMADLKTTLRILELTLEIIKTFEPELVY